MDTVDSFGRWLRQRRKALGLTHATLAERAHCSVSALRKIEQDERHPSHRLAERLAACLEIPAAEIPCFVEIARGERRAERLANVSAAPLPLLAETYIRPKAGAATITPQRQHQLPIPPTPLVGRESELEVIAKRLEDPECRLLTLLGPGGIGKTRLALAAARVAHEQSRFADGVYWVALASVSNSEFVIPAIADAIDLVSLDSADVHTHLTNTLRGKRLLLVLDNLEHLLASVDWLTALLQDARGLKVLATSRERLNVRGEWVLDVNGLAAPPAGQRAGLEVYDSVAMFVQCASRGVVDFGVPASQWPWVTRICRLLGGIPLALELAASWTRLLTCQEIALQIERGLDFLTSSMRDVPDRHRSLRATFDHSWRLLSEDEQRILRRLTVFCGGFRLEAAEYVTRATLPLLSSLADKSLLRRSESGRYELHELIRQYAASHLQTTPAEEVEMRSRHSQHYLALLQQCESALGDWRQPATVATLTHDIDNLRLAWAWAVAHADLGLLRRAARPLWHYCTIRSLLHEGEAMFRQAVERARTLTPTADVPADVLDRLLGRLELHQAAFAYRVGRSAEAKTLLKSSIELLRRHDDQPALVDALWFHALACWLRGELEEFSRYASQGRALACQLPTMPWRVEGMIYSGMVAHERGDYAEAYRCLSEALDLGRMTGNPATTAVAASLLCRTSCHLGKFAEIEQVLRELLQAATATDDPFCKGMALEQLAQVARARGDIQGARPLCEESIALYRQISDPLHLSRTLALCGELALATGESDEAQHRFTEAFARALGAQVYPIALSALAGLAKVWPRTEEALAMALTILRHPSATKATRNRAERLRGALAGSLEAKQIEAAQARASTEGLEAIARALSAQTNGVGAA